MPVVPPVYCVPHKSPGCPAWIRAELAVHLKLPVTDHTPPRDFALGFESPIVPFFDEACIEFAPSFAQARINLARVLMRVGRWEDAGKHLMRALTLVQERARGDVHVRMATVLVEMGPGDEAVSHLEDALRLNPNNAKAKRALTQLKSVLDR